MSETTERTPANALAKLKQGNQAYVKGETGSKIDDAGKRKELSGSQHPFAVIVTCSDSRVPPERLFGAGCGDLFVVRNAGNCVDTAALGSIQYGVAALGAPLVVVMGHSKCGAVKAAADVVNENKAFPGVIGRMIEPIIPAVLSVREQKGDLVDHAVTENARRVAKALRADPLLAAPLADAKLDILGARYDIDSGEVQFFEDKVV